MERAGIPTVLLCNLISIAKRVGAPRIVQTRGIPYPTGDPSLNPEAEKAWRRQLLERALQALETVVHQPTVFSMDPTQAPTAKPTAGAATAATATATAPTDEEAHA